MLFIVSLSLSLSPLKKGGCFIILGFNRAMALWTALAWFYIFVVVSSPFVPSSTPRGTKMAEGSWLVQGLQRSPELIAGNGASGSTVEDSAREGRESFASYESLEQLHRFLFVLGVTHVSYSFFAIALAMIEIYSWRTWENQAKAMAPQELEGSPQSASNHTKMRRLSTFIFHHTSHPWSQHRVLVWLLCFSRQFWSSINRADYMALRLGFITASIFKWIFPTYIFSLWTIRTG